jgi:RNA polymerase sigma-70 factor (ECF subfamily)
MPGAPFVAASRAGFEYTSEWPRMPRLAYPPESTPNAAPPSRADEDALLSRLRAGDREAFAALVQRHGGALLRFAQIFAKSKALAEDLVQETWLAALEGLRGFEGRASVRTWLFRILANRARTRITRDRRIVAFSTLAQSDDDESSALDPDHFGRAGRWDDPPVAWSAEDPERLVQDVETRAAIEAAIAELPEGQRAVITLRDVEGMDADEICNLLAITVTNQRVLLHRARVRVRKALERHLGGAR